MTQSIISDLTKTFSFQKTLHWPVLKKLVFQHGNDRTSILNPTLALIFKKNEKAEDIIVSENVFGDVARAGAFSNQFIEGMKLLYELEPLIKVKPYLTNQWEKSDGRVKNAS